MLSPCLGNERSGGGAQTELQENGERWKTRKEKGWTFAQSMDTGLRRPF